MLGNPFNSRTNKRKHLARSDTAPSINRCHTPTANQTLQSDLINVAPLFINDLYNQCEFREQKYLTRKHRGCSPPSTIKYRIRHKSAAASEYRRKLSDTSIVLFDIIKKRSHSVDPCQNQPVNVLKKQMSEAALSKLSRSLSKRMPRSGSAKNLMDLRDDPGFTWSEGKVMQKDLTALFSAIEKNDVKRVETLLKADPSIVNATNKLELTPLDVAMLYNYPTVAKRLIEFGGRNNECYDNEPRLLHSQLTLRAKNISSQLLEYGNQIYNSSGSINRDNEPLESLNNQVKSFKYNLEQMKPGSMPRKVTLEVAGLYSLLVTVYPPSDSIVTRYKIEWSRESDFCVIDDNIMVRTMFPIGLYELCDLEPHVPYFVRVSSVNLKGIGPSLASVPAKAEPSCWTETVNLDSSIIKRCPHPQEWCPVHFNDEETCLDQQLQFWLASIKSRNHTAAQSGNSHIESDQKRHIPGIGGRKSLLKTLFTSSSKFIRQPKHGFYIALVYNAVDTDRYLTCGEEQLPFVMVDEDHPSLSAVSAECIWLMRLLANKPDLKLLVNVLGRLQLPASVQLRVKLIIAICQLQMTLDCRDLGLLYPCVIQETNYSVIVLTKQIPIAKQLTLPTGIKWLPLSKLSKMCGNLNDSVSSQSGLDDELYSKIETFISFFRRNNTSLEDGLYIGYVRFKSTLDQLYIQQNIFSPTIFPVVKIRDNWHVDKDEWNHFLALKCSDMSSLKNSHGSKLQNAVVKSWQKLQVNLKLKSADSENCRLYLEEILWLKRRVSVILIVPSIEDFCGLPGREINLPLDYEWVSLHAFEYYHFHSNLQSENQFSEWASLNSSVEVLLPIAQHCLRQGFDKNEIDQCKERLEHFQSIQSSLERYWKNLRWSVDVINNCRDKQISNMSTMPIKILLDTDVISHSVLSTEIHCPESTDTISKNQLSLDISLSGNNLLSKSNFPSSNEVDRSPLYPRYNNILPPTNNNIQHNQLNNNSSMMYDSGIASNSSTIETRPETEDIPSKKSPVKGLIRVYAGYPCGLLEGTSVKLLLNSHTTSSDVVKLIVTQLNLTSAARNHQAPQYSERELRHFCLIVTIDSISRPLPDNFHPLLLKQPWKSGKLSVTLRSPLLTNSSK